MSGVLILAVIFIFFIGLVVIFSRSRTPAADETQQLYHAALNHLLLSEREEAYRKLKIVVERNSEHVEAYIHLGTIMREKGQPDRALHVHRNLLHRPNLSGLARQRVLKAVAADQMAKNDLKGAIATLEELTALNKNDPWVNENLLRIQEQSGDWARAFSTKKRLLRQGGEKDQKLLALYKVEEGLALVNKNEEHQARLRFREALNVDPACSAAYLQLGHSYYRAERVDDAIKEWKNLIAKVPGDAFLTFRPLGKALYEKGDFTELENLYRSILNHQQQDVHTLLALADILDKKGEKSEAIQLCQDALGVNEKLLSAHCQLLKYQKDNPSAVEREVKSMEQIVPQDKFYICRTCHHRSAEPLWRCPQCGSWRSFGI